MPLATNETKITHYSEDNTSADNTSRHPKRTAHASRAVSPADTDKPGRRTHAAQRQCDRGPPESKSGRVEIASAS